MVDYFEYSQKRTDIAHRHIQISPPNPMISWFNNTNDYNSKYLLCNINIYITDQTVTVNTMWQSQNDLGI